MKDGFFLEDGKYGKRMVVTSKWNNVFEQYIVNQDIRELCLNYAKGWKGENLLFLNSLSNLQGFIIIDWNIADISPIHNLHSLRYLQISTYCKTAIDFTQFPLLEECRLEWRAKTNSLFDCRSLKILFLNRYSAKDTSKFSQLINLESLSLANSPIRSLDGLKLLTKLKFLGLYNLRKLESLSGIEELYHLEELEINGCRSLRSIKEVEKLANLRKLQFCDDGDIDSIKYLESLTNLESVLFYGSTNVLDGDLSFLKKLPRLKKVSFQNRKHYSHKGVDFE